MTDTLISYRIEDGRPVIRIDRKATLQQVRQAADAIGAEADRMAAREHAEVTARREAAQSPAIDLDFAIIRKHLGRFNQDQVDGFNLLIAEARRREMMAQRLAYVLATAWHETGGKMRPVHENLNYSAKGLRATFARYFTPERAEEYARQPEKIANRAYANRIGNGDEASGDGWTYRGRGFVQITGRANYRTFSKLLGLDLEGEPDLALEPRTATAILFEGMEKGLFTGRALSDYIDTGQVDYVGARWIVNRQDKAKEIARYAGWFETALTQATA